MSRRAAFTQADLERTLRAFKAVGEPVQGVRILPDGSVCVLTGAPIDLADDAGKGGSDWDFLLKGAA